MRDLISSWNKDLLDDEFIDEIVDRKFVDAQWLGYPPATAEAIAENEDRLGVKLPPSYRAFLSITDGWVYPGNDMDFPGKLRSVEELEWANDSDASVVRAFADAYYEMSTPDEQYFVYGPDQDPVHIRAEYFGHCIVVSEETEGGVYLLNRAVQTDDGEWEAWHLSSELPGAYRSRSFEELIRQQHALLRHYRDD